MKKFVTTFLIAMTMAVALFVSACGGSGAANNANNSKPTPLPTANTTAVSNTGDKAKIEEALKKAGFADVTVDTSTTPATLRGSIPKGKAQDLAKAAMEAAGKPVKNETTEK